MRLTHRHTMNHDDSPRPIHILEMYEVPPPRYVTAENVSNAPCQQLECSTAIFTINVHPPRAPPTRSSAPPYVRNVTESSELSRTNRFRPSHAVAYTLINQYHSPPPIQMFELPPPPDYDIAVNQPSPSDQHSEPPPAYRTIVNQLSRLTTSDPAFQHVINIDRDPLRAISHSAPPYVNQPSVISSTTGVPVQRQLWTVEPIDTSDGSNQCDWCLDHLMILYIISWIMVNIGVLYALIPFILGCKADKHSESNPKKARRYAIASWISLLLTIVVTVTVLLIVGLVLGLSRKIVNNCSTFSPYSEKNLCYKYKDCTTSIYSCSNVYNGSYSATTGCCYYNFNPTTSTTPALRNNQNNKYCPYDSFSRCFVYRDCSMSESVCNMQSANYYSGCCYSDNTLYHPASTTPTTQNTNERSKNCGTYFQNNMCYMYMNCMTSAYSCSNANNGFYSDTGCCYYNFNPTISTILTTSTTPAIRTTQNNNYCPYGTSLPLCFTYRNCTMSESRCTMYFSTVYWRGCCYYDYLVFRQPLRHPTAVFSSTRAAHVTDTTFARQ